MLQWVRSLIYTVLLFAGTMAFGVVVLVSALLPLSIEQRYVIPRNWGLFHTWLAKVVCGLDYTVEGQENLPAVPFVSLWKHSSTWDTLAQMFVVPTASWLLKREVIQGHELEDTGAPGGLRLVFGAGNGSQVPGFCWLRWPSSSRLAWHRSRSNVAIPRAASSLHPASRSQASRQVRVRCRTVRPQKAGVSSNAPAARRW